MSSPNPGEAPSALTVRIEIAGADGASLESARLESALANLNSRLERAMIGDAPPPEPEASDADSGSGSDADSDCGSDSDSDCGSDSGAGGGSDCYCDSPQYHLAPDAYPDSESTCTRCGREFSCVAFGRVTARIEDARRERAASPDTDECASAHGTDSESEAESEAEAESESEAEAESESEAGDRGPGPAAETAPSVPNDGAILALFGLAGAAMDAAPDATALGSSDEEDLRCHEELRAAGDCASTFLDDYGGHRVTVEWGGDAECMRVDVYAAGASEGDDEETPLPAGLAAACGPYAEDIIYHWGKCHDAYEEFFAGLPSQGREPPAVLLPTPVADVLALAERACEEMERRVDRAAYEEFARFYFDLAREYAWTQGAVEDDDTPHPSDGMYTLGELHAALVELDAMIFAASGAAPRGAAYTGLRAMMDRVDREFPTDIRAPEVLPSRSSARRVYRDICDNFKIRAEQELLYAEPAADKNTFARLVCEIGQGLKSDLGFSAEAVALLQEAAETYVAETFDEYGRNTAVANAARVGEPRPAPPRHDDFVFVRGGGRMLPPAPAATVRDAEYRVFNGTGRLKRRRDGLLW